MKYLFDLDGTMTRLETLPVIAEHFGCQEEISALTEQTVKGFIPFVESFIRRVQMLGKFTVSEINDLLSRIPLYQELLGFVTEHRENCVIVTGNLTCWCEGLFQRLGCKCYGSEAEVKGDRVWKLKSILRKEDIVDRYRADGEQVVFIGDGHNDQEAMRHADISIAVGITHQPPLSLMSVCDYLVLSECALVRQLRQLSGVYDKQKSVVLCCAGIGSRLGLGLTKALVRINGKSLLSIQLKLLSSVKDVRLVIGYQGLEIIEEVRKYRDDVIFCMNHRYFETKTGASFYLGARHANECILEWDGDLLVHPDDVQAILDTEGEFLCYSERNSDQAVWVQTDADGQVLAFSWEQGDYEWTGPACICKRHLVYSSQNVLNIFEPCLPMKGLCVRAYDIDTYDDYQRVSAIVRDW